jgi:hypothetical protein
MELLRHVVNSLLALNPGSCAKLAASRLIAIHGQPQPDDLDLFDFGGEADLEVAEQRELALQAIELVLDQREAALETKMPDAPAPTAEAECPAN